MTIEKGQPWGTAGIVPSGLNVARSDREVIDSGSPCAVSAGNLHAALGRPSVKNPGDECMLLPVDGMRVEVERPDGTREVLHAVSDVTVGSWWARSGWVVVSNTGHIGSLNLLPRAHPNDGRLDVLVLAGSMGYRERMTARGRARTGSHLSHPDLSVKAVTEWAHTRRGRERLRVDGSRVAEWSRIVVMVEPDRWLVVV